ncbi:NAD-dependent epimerase/dehydratase family protein [Actinocrispum wychmicini]|uniref:CDP-paratose 2-epimerase n=1 Tax=Actinocrispum wychmicini TaxID=1213861 RepID=A0A4R2IMB9_9PSEU|nr:NAD-dependent epimerase/dehydratase family protein [Actinocrispum wychmicini]TCO45857.1 CDP-paratose 2-epimerase [Actinocrispum wychmicini]
MGALLRDDHDVVIVDSLSRSGSLANLNMLLDDAGSRLTFVCADVRDAAAMTAVVYDHQPDAVAHLAGQVAVTTSVTDPGLDFDINARGTLNVLEAVRTQAPAARVLFTSTNKVYGDLAPLTKARVETRYHLPDYPRGVDEDFPTDAATPYGCSKLAGDLYVRDYARTFGLATTVFRMSCIYGQWQNGTVDQGWVSWLTRRTLAREPITIFGDGMQVRDLLHVDDLVEAMLPVLIDGRAAGEVFNVGGGPDFSISVWREFGPLLAEITGQAEPEVAYEPRRAGDQDVYISDLGRIASALSWRPKISPKDGVARMVEWLRARL